MIFIFTEIKGYVTWAVEGPHDYDVLGEKAKFTQAFDSLTARRPEWNPVDSDEELRHAAYKEYQKLIGAWEAERAELLKSLCGEYGDIVEAFVQSLINNHGFKMAPYLQIEW